MPCGAYVRWIPIYGNKFKADARLQHEHMYQWMDYIQQTENITRKKPPYLGHALDHITLMGMMQKKNMYTSITDLTSKVVVKTRIKPRKKRGKKNRSEEKKFDANLLAFVEARQARFYTNKDMRL